METRAKGVLLAFMFLNEHVEIDLSKTVYFPVDMSLVSPGIKEIFFKENTEYYLMILKMITKSSIMDCQLLYQQCL